MFVEVRTRRGDRMGTVGESVTLKKQRKLVDLAQEYLQAREIEDQDWRIDVVALASGETARWPASR